MHDAVARPFSAGPAFPRLRAPSSPWLAAAARGAAARPAARPTARDDLKSGPEIIYERASKSLAQQDYDNAIRLYEALNARYPFAAESRQARLDLIYAYYKGRETESALDAADTFIRENPTHPRVDYAWYIKGLVDFERTPNVLERFFKVDLTSARRRPRARPSPRSARSSRTIPKSEYAHDARRRMIHLRNRLADYQLYVARYYMKRGA